MEHPQKHDNNKKEKKLHRDKWCNVGILRKGVNNKNVYSIYMKKGLIIMAIYESSKDVNLMTALSNKGVCIKREAGPTSTHRGTLTDTSQLTRNISSNFVTIDAAVQAASSRILIITLGWKQHGG